MPTRSNPDARAGSTWACNICEERWFYQQDAQKCEDKHATEATKLAGVAQSAEQGLRKSEVASSNPVSSSIPLCKYCHEEIKIAVNQTSGRIHVNSRDYAACGHHAALDESTRLDIMKSTCKYCGTPIEPCSLTPTKWAHIASGDYDACGHYADPTNQSREPGQIFSDVQIAKMTSILSYTNSIKTEQDIMKRSQQAFDDIETSFLLAQRKHEKVTADALEAIAKYQKTLEIEEAILKKSMLEDIETDGLQEEPEPPESVVEQEQLARDV